MEKFARWWVDWHREIKIGLVLFLVGSLAVCCQAKAETRLGVGYGFSHNATGAAIATVDHRFRLVGQTWYAGGMYFLEDPDGHDRTLTACDTPATAAGSCRRSPAPPPAPVCSSSHDHDRANVNAGLFAGWQVAKIQTGIGSFDAGIGVVAFDQSDVMTNGHSTVHFIATYQTPSPVSFNYQYAGGSFVGINFTLPIGKRAAGSWAVEVTPQ